MSLIGIGISILKLFKKSAAADDSFTFRVKTDNPGTSSSTQFKLPLTSGFNGVTAEVDWGDGSSDTITVYNQSETTHTYSSAGTYTVKISNALRGWKFANGGDKQKMIEITQYGIFELSEQSAFAGCNNMTQSATDAPNITVTDISSTFYLCSNFNGNVSTWDVSNVTNFYRFFRGCTVFNQPLNSWDVGSATTFQEMFRDTQFNQPLSNWNINGVFNMQAMFYNADDFNQDLSNWDTSTVTSMNQMFRFAEDKTSLNISGWDTGAVISFYGMFQNCNFNDDISGWDTSSCQTFSSMLQSVDEFDQQIGLWDITGISNANGLLNFLRGSNGLSTSNYDDLLVRWEAQASSTPTGISANFGSSQFTLGGLAETARTNLINTYSWTISDGGGI